jgi:sulfur carrier protein ThiS
MDLLKDLAVPEVFLVAVNDLIVPDTNTGVAILEEPVGVVM